MTAASPSGIVSRLDERLTALRADDTRRRRALAGAVLLGLLLAWVHWVGLVVGGAVVGLTRRRGRWAVLSGAAFGALALAATVLLTPISPSEFVALRPVNYLTAASSLLLPVWGSLARYVV
jgi:hypothetical protein